MKLNIQNCSKELIKFIKSKYNIQLYKNDIQKILDKYYDNEIEYQQTPKYQKAVLKIQKRRSKGEVCLNYCELKYLPPIPEGVKVLKCNNNRLVKLPSLPNGLISLECRNNQLTILTDLPLSLQGITFGGNPLTELPYLHPHI